MVSGSQGHVGEAASGAVAHGSFPSDRFPTSFGLVVGMMKYGCQNNYLHYSFGFLLIILHRVSKDPVLIVTHRTLILGPLNYPLTNPKHPLLRTIRAPLKGHWGALIDPFQRSLKGTLFFITRAPEVLVFGFCGAAALEGHPYYVAVYRSILEGSWDLVGKVISRL